MYYPCTRILKHVEVAIASHLAFLCHTYRILGNGGNVYTCEIHIQAIAALNHGGICLSYDLTWQYLKKRVVVEADYGT